MKVLRDIRHDMTGCQDTKLAYFNQGLIETVVPMLEKTDLDCRVACEVFALLNSFLFGCDKAVESIRLLRHELVGAVISCLRQLTETDASLRQACLRFVRSQLKVNLFKPSDFDSEETAQSLARVLAQMVHLS